MNRRRLVVVAAIALVTLLLLAAFGLPLLLDLDRHRGRIEQALVDATGWQAELGDLGFSVLQGLSVTASPVRLSAPEGGSSLDIGTVRIRADLFPLLRGELHVRSVELSRPVIELVHPSAERGWILPVPGVDTTAAAEPGDEDAGAGGFDLAIDNIEISGGALRLADRSTDPARSLEIGELDLVFDPVEGTLRGSAEAAAGGALKLDGAIAQDLTLTLEDLATDALARWIGEDVMRGGGRLNGDIVLSLPQRVSGKIAADDLSLLAGEQPLKRAEVDFEFSAVGEGWQADRLDITAGDARLTGTGQLLPDLALEFVLPSTSLAASLQLARAIFPFPLELASPGTVAVTARIDQPANGELTFQATGTLAAASFAPGGILPVAEGLATTFELSPEGAFELRIDKGTVGGGPLTGRVRIDSVSPIGTLTFDGALASTPMGTILAGLVGESAEKITGPTGLRANVALDLSRPELDVHALTGSLDLGAEGVSVAGWDLERSLRLGLKKKLGALAGVAALLDPDAAKALGDDDGGGDAVQRVLDTLASAISFDELPWALDQVALRSDEITATGSGSFDPVAGTVDLQFSAQLDPELTKKYVAEYSALRSLVDDRGRLTLPLRLSGPLVGPKVDVDVDELLSDPIRSLDPEKAVKGLLEGLLDR